MPSPEYIQPGCALGVYTLVAMGLATALTFVEWCVAMVYSPAGSRMLNPLREPKPRATAPQSKRENGGKT
jgi:hypothetical protein